VDDLPFTLDDITHLTQTLSTLQPKLNKQDYKLLMAIFAAAAARIDGTGPVTLPQAEFVGQAEGAPLPDTPAALQEQLLTAYIPGNYFQGRCGQSTVGEGLLRGPAGNPAAGEGGKPA
jgi:hypothetical protein